MFRHILTGTVLAVILAAPSAAQTRATYVLSNGEKHNGVIVYGRGDNNIVDMKYHVNKSGQELVFEHSDVVVIDFVGSSPSADERRAVSGDDRGLMVMRDGSTIRGTLHNIVKPDLVQWVNEGGQRNNYPISEVRRLYLNPDAARRVFLNGSTGASGGGAVTTRSGGVFGRSSTSVRVEGNQEWVDTGLDVRRGDRIAFSASGTVEYAPGTTANPAGQARDRRTQTNVNAPLVAAPAGSLIGRIGNSEPFAIGTSREITAQEDGRLMLSVNDDIVSDNKGAFTVQVRR